MTRRLGGLLAALLLATATFVGLSAPQAQAAYCSGSGVGVVVDFGDLGGGVRTDCGSGSKASTAFTSAGVTLENDGQGFVCRVASKPDPGKECMATNAYWALFVSKQGGAWTYASQGVYTQPVSSGDSVAFVWQSSNSRKTPGADPQPLPRPSAPVTSEAPSTAPTKRPSPKPMKKRSTAPAAPTPTAAGVSVTPSAEAKATPGATPTAGTSAPAAPTADPASTEAATLSPTTTELTATESTSTDVDAQPTAADSDGDGGGLPGWVPPVIVVLLAAAAGGVAWVRRAR
ncbi:hypothetical protein SAMN04487968_10673 [Nocardioides terrae]|uniref:Uncharacterized protein n=1 Tax=Nocardioides terrae TaxID=574651 RepID=A0A1I1J2M5_9ACTN|nr:hypothetical protein [Nocardioides terrae]SFC39710.1 hypothetical protein SAMN04487968_10673 [Nocardioides terrae]